MGDSRHARKRVGRARQRLHHTRNVREVLSREAAELCRELVMGGLEDLRSPFEVNAFIHSVPTLKFNRDGDREEQGT